MDQTDKFLKCNLPQTNFLIGYVCTPHTITYISRPPCNRSKDPGGPILALMLITITGIDMKLRIDIKIIEFYLVSAKISSF